MYGLGRYHLTAVCLLALSALAVVLLAGGALAKTTYIDGDLVVTSDRTLEDGTWVVNGTVNVQGGTLTLDEVRLEINLPPRVYQGIIVTPGAKVTCHNSTLVLSGDQVNILLTGLAAFYDTDIEANITGLQAGGINVERGHSKFYDCNLTKFNIRTTANLTAVGCRFTRYTSAINAFYFWPEAKTSRSLLVEDCTFDTVGDIGDGVTVSGPEAYNMTCTVVVRNNTFGGAATPLSISAFHYIGSVLVEGNEIDTGGLAVNMQSAGPAVVLRNNTIRGGNGIYVYNMARVVPDIHDNHVTADGKGLILSGRDDRWTIWGMNVSAFIALEVRGYHLKVRNSNLTSTDPIAATDATIALEDCEHDYRGEVHGTGSWIREHMKVWMNPSRWTTGAPLTGGNATVWAEDGTYFGEKPNDLGTLMDMVYWQVDEEGTTYFSQAHAEASIGGWLFTSGIFDLEDGAVVTPEFVDDFTPKVSILDPVSGALIAGTTVSLDGTYKELGTGLALVRVRCDDGEWTELTAQGNGTWEATLEMVCDGAHTLEVYVEDLAGNGASANVTGVVTDSGDPFIEVLGPAPWVNHLDIVLRVRTEPGARAFVDDVEVFVLPNGTFTKEFTLSGGVVAFHIRVEDLAGNTNETVYSVVVDQDPPIVAVDQPVNGSYLSALDIQVLGAFEEGASILVNGLLPQVTGTTYSINLTADGEGPFDVTVTVTDRAGNAASKRVRVNIDLTPPTLILESPEEGSLTNASSVNVSGVSVDLSGVTLAVNGLPAAWLPDGQWYLDIDLDEGDTEILVIAEDAAGNRVTKGVNVSCDRTAPSGSARLRFGDSEYAPGDDILVNATSGTLEVTVDQACTLTIEGLDVFELEAGSNNITITLPADQASSLVLEMVDDAGNSADAVVFDVTTDVTAPGIGGLDPPSGSNLTSKDVSLTGTTEAGATLTVEGKSVPVGANGSFQVLLDLEEGQNSFKLVVRDAAGNAHEETLELSYEIVDEEDDEGGSIWVPVLAAILLVGVLSAVAAWKLRRE